MLLVSSHTQRTLSGPEHETSTNSSGRRTTASLPGTKLCRINPITKYFQSHTEPPKHFITFPPYLRPPQPRAHDYENISSGYGYSDHPAPPRAPTRPDAAYKGMTSTWAHSLHFAINLIGLYIRHEADDTFFFSN